ncbi:MAG: TonB-dependent receptor [Bacteroidales bacterium]|nr:TonB-dependent receptor [Bacteroidales bacterium]
MAFASLTLSAQQIDMSLDKVTVRKALEHLQREYNYSVNVRSDEIDIDRVVSVKSQGATLTSVLNQIFAGQDVEYSINGTSVSVKAKKAVAPVKPASRQITGVVVDEESMPLAGAAILEKGTNNGVIADLDGKYTITPTTASPVLVFSFFGYGDEEIAVGKSSVVDAKLTPQSLSLDDVVVVGYGTMTRRDITSAVSSFKPKPSERREVLSVDQMLQGRVAGVNITTASGIPGASSRVSIRGIGSLNAGNEPLYVIDGVILSTTSGDTGAYGAGESMSGLATVNPSDIESIEVLKDAASAAIYGSRATNGVIIITTKSGKKGAPKVAVDASVTMGQQPRTHTLELASGDLLIEVFNEGIDNYNRQFGQNIERFINPMPGKPAYDWLGSVLRTSWSHNITASISGGTDNTKYYVSGTYKHTEGTAVDNDMNQYSLKANVSGKVKPWLSFGVNTMLSYSKNSRVASGYSGHNVIKAAVEQYPWHEPFLPNGDWATSKNILVNNNALQAIKESDVWIKTYRALSSAFLEFHIIPGLNFKTNLGEDYQSLEEHVYFTAKHASGYPTEDNPMGGRLTDARVNRVSLLWDNTLSYDKSFDMGLNLGAVLGHSMQIYESSTATQTGLGFPSASFDVNAVAATFEDVSSSKSAYALQSFFGRVNLNYKNRYVGTFTVRTDGSSKFAPEHRWGWFPSASLGWNINEEQWWNSEDISLKVRASVGATGNQGGIGAYAYQALASGGINYGGQNGLGLTTAGNRDLKWETAIQENVGIDASFWKGALSVTVDLFNKDTQNLLYQKPTMVTTGYTSQMCNIGAMNNKGIEIALAANAGKNHFRWHADFNISFIRNKLTKLLDDNEIITPSGFHGLKVGEEVGSFYMVKMLGIYQHDEDVPEYLYENEGVRAGDVIYEDISGPDGVPDGKIDANDRQFVGSANPKFSGGFNNTFSWKGLELGVFLTYSYGQQVYEYWTGGLRLGNGQWPQLRSVCENRWTGPGTTNTTPRAIYGQTWNSTKFVNTRFLHDASYLRIRSVSLGYNFPSRLLQKAKIDALRIYFQADNLYVFTPWPYLDPEVSVSSNAATYGYDWLNPGQPRTFSLGFNIKF